MFICFIVHTYIKQVPCQHFKFPRYLQKNTFFEGNLHFFEASRKKSGSFSVSDEYPIFDF